MVEEKTIEGEEWRR